MNDPCELMNQYQVINCSISNRMNSSQQHLMNQLHSSNQFQTLDILRHPALVSLMNPSLNQSNLIPSSYGNNLKFPKQRNPNFGGSRRKWKGKKGGKLSRRGAPRNTSSYLIRAKKEGGISSLVSPLPVTPAVLSSPALSPAREAVVDMAKEEWGVDGYGSMTGLIRLRATEDDYEEEHLEGERRLDQDVSRFEMVYPNPKVNASECANVVLGNRVDDQDTQISQLEQENLSLRHKMYWLESELGQVKRRMRCLERQHNIHSDAHALYEHVQQQGEEEISIPTGHHQALKFQNVSQAELSC